MIRFPRGCQPKPRRLGHVWSMLYMSWNHSMTVTAQWSSKLVSPANLKFVGKTGSMATSGTPWSGKECMVILYMASEPWSAGMLEASLIDRYIVFWQHLGAAYFWWLFDWIHCITMFEEKHVLEPMAYHIKNKMLAMSDVPAQASQGCKNLRRGGDTVSEREDTSAVYMVYVVYRSFKVKPP